MSLTQLSPLELVIEPLTKESFKEFGDVIETDNSEHFMINNGSTKRYHELAKADVEEQGGNAIISIFVADTLEYPLNIKMLERHPLGSQAFIPMLGNSYLVVVAPKGNTPKVDKIRAFLTNGKQGVNYHKGVWHHPILSLFEGDKFLIVDRAGDGNNCDEHHFKSNFRTVSLTQISVQGSITDKETSIA